MQGLHLAGTANRLNKCQDNQAVPLDGRTLTVRRTGKKRFTLPVKTTEIEVKADLEIYFGSDLAFCFSLTHKISYILAGSACRDILSAATVAPYSDILTFKVIQMANK